MKIFFNFAIALCLFIFIPQVQADDFGDLSASSNFMTLNMCTDKTIGYQIKCSPNWIVNDSPGSVMMIIVDEADLSVTATINKLKEQGITINKLTDDKLRYMGQYDKQIEVERVKVSGVDAIKVFATAKDINDLQLLDYYLVKDGVLYSVLFSVSPKEKFADYKNVFEAMIQSFNITK